jgi:hypothetical protein
VRHCADDLPLDLEQGIDALDRLDRNTLLMISWAYVPA